MTTLREAIARALGETYDGYADPAETPNNWARALSGAEAILAAIETAGWQCVPKEPTSDMLEAFDKGGLFTWHKFTSRYAKLLAAAPKPGGEQ